MNPGKGYRLLKEGETIREGDTFRLFDKWVKTGDVGMQVLGLLVYRRKLSSKSKPSLHLPASLLKLIAARAEHLQITPTAYVTQVVRGELSKSKFRQIQTHKV